MEGGSSRKDVPLERVACPLCKAREEEFLFEGRDRIHGVPGTFPVVRCRACSLIYINPRPSREGMARYYPPGYFTHRKLGTTPRKGLKPWIRKRIVQWYYGYPGDRGAESLNLCGRLLALPLFLMFKCDRRNSLVIPYQGDGRFLDVGCGDGSMLSFMRAGGWDVAGVEPDAGVADRLVTECGYHVHAGEIEDSPFEPGTFDVILMSHVLEHLRKPTESLNRVHQLLKSGGRLYLRLPDGNSFCAKRFKDQWFSLDVPRHLCTYTRETVRTLLEQTGFEVESFKQDRNFLGLRKTLQFLDEKPGKVVSFLMKIKPLMQAVEYLILLFRRGDAMIICCRKP